MKHFIAILGLIGLLVLVLLLLPQPLDDTQRPAADLAFTDVRVFDGTEVIEQATVVVRDGRIAEAGPDVAAPAGTEILDGTGHTLLPGLIDSHVHAFGSAREDALRFGVTTELDMFSPPGGLPDAKAQRESLDAAVGADLFSAGFLATAEGGHGTQYGIDVPLPGGPEGADEWVQARIDEGSDYIKIIIEDGAAWNRELPTLDAATVAALVAAAHAHDRLTVVHVSTLAAAETALAAGADGLVHVFTDRPVSRDFLDRAAGAGLFVVPTTVVQAAAHGHGDSSTLIGHPVLGERLSAGQKQSLGQDFPGSDLRAGRWPVVRENIRALHAAGIPILAGSDAPNPGTAHGVSMHRELALLVEAGLKPTEALAAATSVPTEHFGLGERGCLKPGCRADMLLVEGDPTTTITDTHDIAGIWKNGHQAGGPKPAAAPGGARARGGGNLLAPDQIGHWQASADDFMGGNSQAAMTRNDDVTLTVTGEVRAGSPFPWAGAMWMAADTPMRPADLSGYSEIELEVTGADTGYRVMFFSGTGRGGPPATVTFPADQAGKAVTIAFDRVAGLDPENLQAVGVFAPPEPGSFEFTIHQARLR